VYSTFKSDMHLPSAEKLWQQPAASVFPNPRPPARPAPDEVHAASYFALSANMVNFRIKSMGTL
jgi:hypothetical protein